MEKISQLKGFSMLRTRSKDAAAQKIRREVEENLSRFWAELGAEMHFSIEKIQIYTNIQHPMFNGVIRTNIPLTIANKRVSEMIEQFQKRGVPYRWVVNDYSKPGNLREILTEKGLSPCESWAGLYHSMELILPYSKRHPAITIQPITNYDAMMIWTANFAESMDIPFKEAKKYADLFTRQGVKPYRHFIASQDGECVGVATLHFLQKVVGIYNLTVKKNYRRHGVGTAIVNYLLNHSKKIDAEGVVLYAPTSQQYPYTHLGFEHIMDFDVFEPSY